MQWWVVSLTSSYSGCELALGGKLSQLTLLVLRPRVFMGIINKHCPNLDAYLSNVIVLVYFRKLVTQCRMLIC